MAASVRIPAVPIPVSIHPVLARYDVQRIVDAVHRVVLVLPWSSSITLIKLGVLTVLLANAGSLPFVWHLRVFWPIIVARLQFLYLRIRTSLRPPSERARILASYIEARCPVGMNPFETTTVYRRWASIDDADMFGFHLSNSSYAKALDSARLRIMWKAFPAWSTSGGIAALGATHYHFIREISLFARYEVRISIASWDHKWLYLIARYVTRPKPKDRRALKASTNYNIALPSLREVAAASDSDMATPSYSNAAPTPAYPGTTPSLPMDSITDPALLEKTLSDFLAASRTSTDDKSISGGSDSSGARQPVLEPDGAVLHCLAISEVCFKQGRITVPPAVALACEGFHRPPSVVPSAGEVLPVSYSRENPPPCWAKVQAVRVPPTGSMRRYKEFLKSGWRETAGMMSSSVLSGNANGNAKENGTASGAGGLWWEEALGGPIEERRLKNLPYVQAIRMGMETIRGIS